MWGARLGCELLPVATIEKYDEFAITARRVRRRTDLVLVALRASARARIRLPDLRRGRRAAEDEGRRALPQGDAEFGRIHHRLQHRLHYTGRDLDGSRTGPRAIQIAARPNRGSGYHSLRSALDWHPPDQGTAGRYATAWPQRQFFRLGRVCHWICFRLWMDTVRRSDPRGRTRIRRRSGHRLERHLSSGHLFSRTGGAFPVDVAWHRALSKVLQPLQVPHACRGGGQRRFADRIGHPAGDGPLRAHLRLLLVLESLCVVGE